VLRHKLQFFVFGSELQFEGGGELPGFVGVGLDSANFLGQAVEVLVLFGQSLFVLRGQLLGGGELCGDL
jgi:hypothetical protein